MTTSDAQRERSRLTDLGIELRKLRIDKNGERLLDMAKRLDVSSAFLSAIEMGRKSPPQGLADEISKLYRLSELETKRLNRAEAVARSTFVLKPSSEDAKETVQALARRIDNLPSEALRQIRDIANNEVKKHQD
jgi:transcriptional regulator with XRE-family HTH domain